MTQMDGLFPGHTSVKRATDEVEEIVVSVHLKICYSIV